MLSMQDVTTQPFLKTRLSFFNDPPPSPENGFCLAPNSLILYSSLMQVCLIGVSDNTPADWQGSSASILFLFNIFLLIPGRKGEGER